MPSIEIKEQDLTYGGGRVTNYNVVYIPGFMTDDVGDGKTDTDGTFSVMGWPLGTDNKPITNTAADAKTPTLCKSVAEFESYFGLRPARFNSDNNDIDKSYIYAKELLKLGLPVLYESMNDIKDAQNSIPIKDRLYNNIASDFLFKKLGDKGEYQFKYLTSGGYPLYNNNTNSTSSDDGETSIQMSNTNFEDFTNLWSAEVGHKYKFEYVGNNNWKLYSFNDSKYVLESDNLFHNKTQTSTFTSYYIYESQYITLDNGQHIFQDCVYGSFRINKDDNIKINDYFEIEIKAEGPSVIDGIKSPTPNAPNEAYIKAVEVALSRGDCMVLIDHEEGEPTPEELKTMYEGVTGNVQNLDGADYCAMFTPWVNIDCSTYKPLSKDDSITKSMPPSFAYLSALAKSIRTNASWLAVAGATRGQIPNLNGKNPLNVTGVLSNSLAESFQNRDSISINAITDIKPFGHRIWGNRTLKNNNVEGNLTATSFLNIRNMICDVKKVVYEACRRYTFEQNNDILWLNFKAYIEPTLNQMKTGAGLSGYKIIKDTTNEKAKLKAQIKLYPLYAVEDFTVEIQMLDDEIAVS